MSAIIQPATYRDPCKSGPTRKSAVMSDLRLVSQLVRAKRMVAAAGTVESEPQIPGLSCGLTVLSICVLGGEVYVVPSGVRSTE